MQTIPTFAYLIPMLLLFGNSPVSAMIATADLRHAADGAGDHARRCRGCRPRSSDFGDMAGCTARQKLWRVLLPSARPTLMVGVNQVIMLALNMVIIASMIGAGGLGYDVLLALRALKVGEAMEAGLAIVALAIALDRLSQAVARAGRQGHGHRDWPARSGGATSSAAGGRHPRRHHAARPVRPGLRERAEGDHLHHRADLEGGGQLDHDQLLRRRSRRSASR